MPSRAEKRRSNRPNVYESGSEDKHCIAMRVVCRPSRPPFVWEWEWEYLYRNAVASRVAKGTLRIVNVPELKQMGINSFLIYDKRKPLTPMAREFRQIVREERSPSTTVDDKGDHTVDARRLSFH